MAWLDRARVELTFRFHCSFYRFPVPDYRLLKIMAKLFNITFIKVYTFLKGGSAPEFAFYNDVIWGCRDSLSVTSRVRAWSIA